MARLRALLRRLLYPHAAAAILLIPISAALLAYCFALGIERAPLAYASYALSAYALAILCARAARLIPFFKRVKRENRYIARYAADARLRVNISLYGSLAFNAAYAALQLGLGVYHASVWFYALAGYYMLLALVRFFLLRYTRANAPGENMARELRLYRACGAVLLGLNLALSVIVAYIVWQNRGFEHHYITAIAMACYTFGALALAIANAARYRKYHSPAYSAAKAISLAAATVSVLTLETAMLAAFGDGDGAFRQLITGLTGMAVMLFILAMAVYMIVNATRQLRALRIGDTEP